MDLRDLANSEASAFIDRLVAAADARTEKAQAEADAQVSVIRRQLETLRSELEGEAARAAALEADLDSVIEAHRQVDADRLAAESGRAQEAGARARIEDELRGVRQLLERARAEASRVSAALEDEAAEKALLQEELDGLRLSISGLEKTHAAAEKKIATLEGRVAELAKIESSLRAELANAASRAEAVQNENAAATQAMRDRFDAAIRTARAEAESLSADRDAARADIETIRQEVEATRQETATIRAQAEKAQAERDALRVEAENLKREKDALKVDASEVRKQADVFRSEGELLRSEASARRAELDAARAEVKSLRAQTDALTANRSGSAKEIASLQEMLDASRQHHERQVATVKELEARLRDAESRVLGVDSTSTATLTSAIRALDALGSAATVSELFVMLVSQLSMDLPRVALFRVKGNHLEGDHAAGLDESVQIKKIVIPMTMDSVIARAASGGTLVRSEGAELANSTPPFGGAPVSAFAVPITFQGETLAVLYADSEKPTTTAHCALALLIVRHSTVLLARLTNELKALKELRDYAMMLIQEAEQMFIADVDAGRPAHESIRRLRDTVDCGRQLFAQRAELEGSAASGVFDEQVSIVISARASAFAEALEAATQDHRRVAS